MKPYIPWLKHRGLTALNYYTRNGINIMPSERHEALYPLAKAQGSYGSKL
jgi:hypothetical protein